ncbi:hypothetical protein DPMN_125353 [Dreissena polymorpha]|uniref:Uncharacterized protein n=1 Tax=Dreissena polymorpha TaxID=45954 RepID=A0A9D4GTT8_DREPO|nr:hypothetical protein DPMN_125353 [Dreissena polymorpha]
MFDNRRRERYDRCTGCVTTLVKQRNGLMLSIHCISHRLALASEQSADKNYADRFQHGVEGRRNKIKCSPNLRFTDNGTVSFFSIFDPSKLPSDDELLTYGNEGIHKLTEFYGGND